MKISTILIITAVVATIIALTAYNFTLRASYLKGDYKNPFYGMEFTPIKNLDAINISSANLVSVTIEQGVKEGIWVSDEAEKKISWSHHGNVLQIDLSKKSKDERDRVNGRSIIVVTNHLSQVNTKALFKTAEDEQSYSSGEVTIKGYKEGNLQLVMDRSSSVYLDNNNLQSFKAIVGDAQHGDSRLSMSKENTIAAADFNVAGASEINLSGPKITKTNYTLSEKATVTLNGKALQSLLQ